MLLRGEQAPRSSPARFAVQLRDIGGHACEDRFAHAGDRDQVQSLLDGTPVIFREQHGIAPLESFCGGDRGHGAAIHARTSKRNASGSGQAVRGLRLDGHHLDFPGINA